MKLIIEQDFKGPVPGIALISNKNVQTIPWLEFQAGRNISFLVAILLPQRCELSH